MTCIVAQRRRAHHCAAVVEPDARVVAATVVGPEAGPRDRFAVDVLLDRSCDGFPTDLLAPLAFDVTVASVASQAGYQQATLLV